MEPKKKIDNAVILRDDTNGIACILTIQLKKVSKS